MGQRRDSWWISSEGWVGRIAGGYRIDLRRDESEGWVRRRIAGGYRIDLR